MSPHVAIEIFLWLLGLCVGSFLNVVIYRLPVGLSLANPPRSFCPHCQAGIAWYDNLPLLSWLLLRGRCRHCATPISVRYPIVEGITGLVFVLVYHLLFVARCRAGVWPAELPCDLPLLFMWLALAAGLVACSAMDLTSYSVDVRVTNLVLILGVLLHAAWPRRAFLLPTATTSLAAGLGAAFIVSGVQLCWSFWRTKDAPASHPDVPAGPGGASRAERFGGVFGILVLVGLALGLMYIPAGAVRSRAADVTVAAALLAIFGTTVLIGGQRRAADEEIQAALDEEQPQARRVALGEVAWLTPAMLSGAAVITALLLSTAGAASWRRVVVWQPGGDFVPLAGAVFAMHGAVIGAGAGWILRIVFTLAYGREAFGVGDIYILAAAGAAVGWDIALLGLLLSVGIALAGWLLGLMMKSTALIPFGPWLALGLLLALWWNRPAQRIAERYVTNFRAAWEDQPQVLLVMAGLMLVGTGAAIVLARVVRRWVAPG